MKNLDDIWNEYINYNSLSPNSLKELTWHMEYDLDPLEAIRIATDMGLKELVPFIAKQLEHEDDYIRDKKIMFKSSQHRLYYMGFLPHNNNVF